MEPSNWEVENAVVYRAHLPMEMLPFVIEASVISSKLSSALFENVRNGNL